MLLYFVKKMWHTHLNKSSDWILLCTSEGEYHNNINRKQPEFIKSWVHCPHIDLCQCYTWIMFPIFHQLLNDSTALCLLLILIMQNYMLCMLDVTYISKGLWMNQLTCVVLYICTDFICTWKISFTYQKFLFPCNVFLINNALMYRYLYWELINALLPYS